MDQQNLPVDSGGYLQTLDAVIQAVKTTNVPQVKLLLERGADVNSVEPTSRNSLLHLAVLHGGYNAAVHLLNRGCSTSHCNSDGLTAVQMAQRLPDRGAFAVAIQLTDRKRRERQLAAERITASATRMTVPSSSSPARGGPLLSLHQLTRRNLEAARGSLVSLEAQVVAAKALVRSLEHQLILIESAAQLADLQRGVHGGGSSKVADYENGVVMKGGSGVQLDLARCGVCLEIARTKIYQCSEGHIFCELCFLRPEMTQCPECRIPIDEPVRNRALEKIIASSSTRKL